LSGIHIDDRSAVLASQFKPLGFEDPQMPTKVDQGCALVGELEPDPLYVAGVLATAVDKITSK
jgi:hypothetical protein